MDGQPENIMPPPFSGVRRGGGDGCQNIPQLMSSLVFQSTQ